MPLRNLKQPLWNLIPGQQAQSKLPDTPTFEEYADYQEEPDNYRWQDGLKVLTKLPQIKKTLT